MPIAGSVRIGIAIFSYLGGLNFGVTGDWDTVTDIDVLTGGIGAVVLAALGVGVLRSQDDKAILARLADVEATNLEVKDRVEHLTHLLETGLLPDEAIDVTNSAQAPARAR